MFTTAGRRTAVRALLLGIVAVSALWIGAAGTHVSVAAHPGLDNPSFEDGVLDGAPADWIVVSTVDQVIVVDAESGADFPTYMDILPAPHVVEPYSGERMLRLGRPKLVSESQTRGDNLVQQTFQSSDGVFRAAVRLFSWEHRNRDQFSFRLTQGGVPTGQLSAVVFTMPDGAVETCGGPGVAAACSFSFDVGSRGEVLDSGWTELEVTGLPIGVDLIVEFGLAGTNDEAHSSWLYVDGTNSPPIAKFTFEPGDPLDPDPPLDEEGNPLQRFEGVLARLLDRSEDPDGPDDIVSWHWEVWGPYDGAPPLIPEADPLTSIAQNPLFIPPDEGIYVVSLTVTDRAGASDTVVSGVGGADALASDGELVPAFSANNVPPAPNGLNVEVLAGPDVVVPAFGRFADPGWTDTHTATFQLTSTDNPPLSVTAAGDVDETHDPALGSGRVTADIPVGSFGPLAPGDLLGGLLTVTDNDGASRGDVFAVRAVEDNPTRFEPNDTLDEAVPLAVDGRYLSYLGTPGDRDVFEVLWGAAPGSGEAFAELPAGAQVLVTLGDLSVDMNLVVVTVQPTGETAPFELSPFELSPFELSPFELSPFELSPFELSPFELSPFELSPFELSPFEISPFQLSPFQLSPFELSAFGDPQVSPFELSPFELSPFQLSPFELSPFELSPFELTDYQLSPFELTPLADVSFTGIDGNEIGGTDIDLSQIGLGDISNGTAEVAAISANIGLEDETVLVRVDSPGTKVYVIVLADNGAHSTAPFFLQFEGSAPYDELAGAADNCAARPAPTGPGAPAGHFTDGLRDLSGGAPRTLFVTQDTRLGATDAAFWNSLDQAAAHAEVEGLILNVPQSVYTAWDANPCGIPEVNAVTEQIRASILAQLTAYPSMEFVVLVGSDDVIPFRRVPDETVISNESLYLPAAFVQTGTPSFSSLIHGQNQTDDFYVDLQPTPFQGRALFIPDYALGRLVENPPEIKAALDAFVASDGVLDPNQTGGNVDLLTDALVSGLDFFTDGATAMANSLATRLDTSTLISEFWTADNMRDALFGSGADVIVPNSHWTHFAFVSAAGFNEELGLDFNDYISSVEVAQAPGAPLWQTIIFTMGCHAGWSVPDLAAFPVDPGLGVDPALDFAQAAAIQNALIVASTGFGLGETIGLGGTELLLSMFADQLMQAPAPVIYAGQALRESKVQYLSSLGVITVYDEKSSIQTTLYGMPHYMVIAQAGPGSLNAAEVGVAQVGPELQVAHIAAGGPHLDLTIHEEDGAPVLDAEYEYEREDVPGVGTYDTAALVPGGTPDAQVTAGRPIQPRVVIPDIDDLGTGGPDVHGALWLGGSFSTESPVDPILGQPNTEWYGSEEPQIALRTYWPTVLAGINSLDAGLDLVQTMVLIPAQFRATQGGGEETVMGIRRLYDALTYELQRGVGEFDLPVIGNVEPRQVPNGTVDLVVNATDASGIARIVILTIDEATGVVAVSGDQTFAAPAPGDDYVTNIPDPGDADLYIQVVDGIGNIAVWDSRGLGVAVLAVHAGVDQHIDPTPTGAFTVLEATIEDFASLNEGDPTLPVFYSWEFGDGLTLPGRVEPTDPGIIEYRENADGSVTFYVRHAYAAAPPLTSTVRVFDSLGGIGVDDAQILPCSDPVNPQGNPARPDGDFLKCSIVSEGSLLHVTFTMRADIDPTGDLFDEDIKYRMRLDVGEVVNGVVVNNSPDGVSDLQVQYDRGSLTPSLSSLEATVDGPNITFTLDLAELGRCDSGAVAAEGETQSGQAGQAGVGKPDRILDAGFATHIFSGGGHVCAPRVQITSPADGATFPSGTPIDFVGTALDPDGGDLTAQLAWSSDLDGPFAQSGGAVQETLSDGVHTIAAAATDTDGLTGTASIVVIVGNQPPDAQDDAATVDEGDAVVVDVRANDTDPDGDPLAAPTILIAPAHGAANVNPDGTVTYTHDGGETTSDDFTYEVCDQPIVPGNTPLCDDAVVQLTVTPVNDPPVAVDDAATGAIGATITTLTGGATSVLDNDTDPDGDALSVVAHSTPSAGSVTVNNDGTFSYQHDGSATLLDSFTYDAFDGTDTVTATVTVTLSGANLAPIANNDAFNVVRRTPTTLDLVTNDVDPDGVNANLAIHDVTQPSRGSVTILGPHTVRYDPGNGNGTGVTTFTYRVIDPGGAISAFATVTVTITR